MAAGGSGVGHGHGQRPQSPPPPATFPPAPVLPIAAPSSLPRYASSALDTDRLRTPVLVYAPYGRGDRLADTVSLAGNAGRRYLRELHTMTGAIQAGTFLLEEDHMQRLYALYETLRSYAAFYEDAVVRVWARWSTADGGGMRSALEAVGAALGVTDAAWAALSGSADAAAHVGDVLRGCHGVSAAAAVAFGRAEAAIAPVLAAAAAGAPNEKEKRRLVRGVEGALVAAAEAAFPGRGLLVLAHWLPTEAYVAKFVGRYLPSGVSGASSPSHRKRLSKEEAAARSRAADAARRSFAAGRSAFEEASRGALAFFERHQGSQTALPGGVGGAAVAGPQRLALLPAPVGPV